MPRRRKQSSSAFEFTGEEAKAVERAFRKRSRATQRRPKISVTSISPLSTVNKILHTRQTHPPKPRKPPTAAPTQPTAAATPPRRSLRKKLARVPVRLRIRPQPSRPEAVHEPPRVKRPRDAREQQELLPTAEAHAKKSRVEELPSLEAGNKDQNVTRGTGSHLPPAPAPPNIEAGLLAAPEKDTENPDRKPGQHSKATGNGVSVGEDRGRLSADDKVRTEGETDIDRDDCGVGKDGKSMQSEGQCASMTEAEVKEDSPSADVTRSTPCNEEKASAVDIPRADIKPAPEETRPANAGASDNVSPPSEQNSAEANLTVEESPSTACATPKAKAPLESPVTPLKPDMDVHKPDDPPNALPTNQQSHDTAHPEELTVSEHDRKDKSLLLPPASTEATPEKATTAPADADSGIAGLHLPKDDDVVAKDSVASPEKKSPISPETDGEKHTVTKAAASLSSDQKPKSDQPSPTPVPADEIREKRSGPKHVDHVVDGREPTPSMLPGTVERNSPPKPPSGVMKRVRFTEPPPYRSAERKLGFSGIMKMRRRRVRKSRALDADVGDVSVAAAGTKGPDEKGRQLLLDELQYLLDGIFKTSTNGGKKGQTVDNQVVASSLQSLVKLLLRKSKNAGERYEEGQEEDAGVLVQILVEQPDLLKTIVKRLCAVLGKSRASDALLALVFVIIFRATPRILLLTEHELDLLLNAFFRNSAASLKQNESDGQRRDDAKDAAEKEPQNRRRGKLGRMFDQRKPKEDILMPLLKLMTEADLIEDNCSAFRKETEAASHLMGIAISLILRNEIETRAWMRENRRLDKAVAVLYSCEKMMLLQPAKEEDQDEDPPHDIEQGSSWIVLEASMRILEFAVLDQVCQRRLALESRVSSIIINLLRHIKSIKTGPMESEWMICAALRLCINLCHGCDIASKQLVDGNGQNAVLNCLVRECLAAGLLQEDTTRERDENVEESFDVRVLCLAVLASTVNQEIGVCTSFHEMQADGVENRERGAISLIIEILRTAELEAKKEECKETSDDGEERIARRKRPTKEEEAEREKRSQFVMERKITIGYVCLLIGALACDSKSNRALIQDLLPGKSFIGVAAVLAEFLEFHHEVGVISGSMNRMYAEIIKKIVEPEAEKDVAVAETDLDDIGVDLKLDSEGQGDELDLLLDAPEGADGEEGADENNNSVGDLGAAGCERALATPVDRTV